MRCGVPEAGTPARELASQTGLAALLMRFVGISEIAGGLGLILPGLVRVHRELTPLAASGLVVIMAGALVLSALSVSPGAAVLSFVVGVLLVLVARGRRGWAMSIS